MKLTHIGISNYRSIGETPVMIDLEKRITVLVGQNDGGKSNVVSGLEWVSALEPKSECRVTLDIDKHKRQPQIHPQMHLRASGNEQDNDAIKAIGDFSISAPIRKNLEGGVGSQEVVLLDPLRFKRLASHMGVSSSYLHPNDAETKRMRDEVTMHLAIPLLRHLTKFLIIPQYRRIEKADGYTIDGKGIIKLLASWQNTELGQEHLRPKFERVTHLLQSLIEQPQIVLDVPRSEKEIIVDNGGQRLPLESHGTGIHQLIIMAIAVLSEDDVIFGIEEPEIHLHPVLQKHFLQFLLNETKNRYIITTHSPALIAPSAEVDVIHLKMVDGVTIPSRVETDAGSLAVLEDLGIQPSDLLQANSVIWVEGPSDRTYLKRWIEILHPGLVEGIDYSIMFYGGRLLAHLSMDREDPVAEEETRDFIKLLRINQRSALVMDSDRDSSTADINDTKKRLIDECKKSGVHCWVTDGREIENYLADEWVAAALKEENLLCGEVDVKLFQRFETSMAKAAVAPGGKYASAKAAWAHRIAKHITEKGMTDELNAHVNDMMRALCPQVR